MRAYLFVYGTLREPAIQLTIIGRVVAMHVGVLCGYEVAPVVINGNEHRTLVGGGGEVSGFILAVSQAELLRIDRYEPLEYKRIRVSLKDGSAAWAYIRS